MGEPGPSTPSPGLDPQLQRALAEAARAPRLLVASDFDGTLAPIVEDPGAARPDPAGLAALVALGAVAGTRVALVSGRARTDLARLSGAPAVVHLVGSHGAEVDEDFADGISPAATELLSRLTDELTALVDRSPGVGLETKPSSVAVHVRGAEPDVAEQTLTTVRTGPASWDGVHVTEGKAVIELAVLAADKGSALALLRGGSSDTVTVFLGDDVTDEKGFARLEDSDVGVKVGAGQTLAAHRVAGTPEVTAILELLLAERRRSSG
ncbi:MAG: trehalose-phosphatase [Mycobacteriaceae bacterium]